MVLAHSPKDLSNSDKVDFKGGTQTVTVFGGRLHSSPARGCTSLRTHQGVPRGTSWDFFATTWWAPVGLGAFVRDEASA